MRDLADSYHLARRNGTWYYRRRVPEDVRAEVGKDVIQFSLGTPDKAKAKRLREKWDVHYSSEFEAARRIGIDDRLTESQPEPLKIALSEREADSLVREYVRQRDRRFRDFLDRDPPEDAAQRSEMQHEIEIEISQLQSLHDPNSWQAINSVEQKLLRGAEIGPGGIIPSAFAEMIRRGLIEIERRKIARLNFNDDDVQTEDRRPPRRAPTVAFGKLADEFLALEREEATVNRLNAKSLARKDANVRLLLRLIGGETPVDDINHDACLGLRRTLARVPTNLTKLYGSLPVAEAVLRASAEGRPTLSPVTQAQYLTTLKEILELALRKGVIAVNPIEGMRTLKRDRVAPADKRLPFTNLQLIAFFRSDFYRSCAASGPAPYRFDKSGGWRFWLPILSLFTGLRPRELLQMHVSDVQCTREGTWFIDVVASGEDSESNAPPKSLKTASSRRQVPLHRTILQAGFLMFVHERGADLPDPSALTHT